MDKYKAVTGRRLTQGLFYEFNNKDAPYTLRDDDFTNRAGKTYKSAAKIYRESVDEYDAAMKIVGSWGHWQLLLNTCNWFVEGINTGGFDFPGIKAWRDEMALRDASRSKELLMEQAEEGNVAAQRYLNEQSKKTAKSGRPEKKSPVKTTSSAVTQFKAIQGAKS